LPSKVPTDATGTPDTVTDVWLAMATASDDHDLLPAASTATMQYDRVTPVKPRPRWTKCGYTVLPISVLSTYTAWWSTTVAQETTAHRPPAASSPGLPG
jgi:hypothetical protein